MQARHVGPAQAWAQAWTSHRAGLGADHAGMGADHAGMGAGRGKPGCRPPCRHGCRPGQARAPQATVQATAQAWASQGAAGHPQGVALLYTAARHGSARPISAFVYSRATPCGWPARWRPLICAHACVPCPLTCPLICALACAVACVICALTCVPCPLTCTVTPVGLHRSARWPVCERHTGCTLASAHGSPEITRARSYCIDASRRLSRPAVRRGFPALPGGLYRQ